MPQRSECLQLVPQEPQAPQEPKMPEGYVPGGVQIATDAEVAEMNARLTALLKPTEVIHPDGTITTETYTSHAC